MPQRACLKSGPLITEAICCESSSSAIAERVGRRTNSSADNQINFFIIPLSLAFLCVICAIDVWIESQIAQMAANKNERDYLKTPEFPDRKFAAFLPSPAPPPKQTQPWNGDRNDCRKNSDPV